ncbi:MAG: neutral/alkaline non-lysosomal ceramidase N-terminal domain-containing protein [Thermomicrobiales bacterium]|nr:neutral/alkaline non-lysosomal ceramidase N-terminal domain-containing protein [Thermomicrobiales bacterium]
MGSQFFAGVARTDITPPIGIAHANWGAQTHQRAAGVDIPLTATALALSDGSTQVVIVDIDTGYLWDSLAVQAMEAITALTGIPQSHIRLAYTHTHSGPSTSRSRPEWAGEGSEMVDSYSDSLAHRLAGVAWAAVQGLQPARIGSGVGSCSISVNRRFQRPEDGAVIVGRNWDGPVDHDVNVLRIDTLDGEPLVAVVNYPCHPITVGWDNELITPDYPGAVRQTVEANTGATCLFLQGAAGDIGPVRGVARNGANEYKRLGAILGLEASRVWLETSSRPKQDRYEGTLESGAPLAIYTDEFLAEPDRTIRVANRTMSLPLRQLPPPDEMQAAFAANLAELTELRANNGDPEEIKLVTMRCKRTAMRAELAKGVQGHTHRDVEAQAIAIGDDIVIVAVPGEPFVQIGLDVRGASPYRTTLFSGYANIGWSYIPMAEAYPLGGYEIEITPWDPATAGQIVAECNAMLQELAGR